MRHIRRVLAGTVVALMLSSLSVGAATADVVVSGEASGNNAGGRAAAQLLRDPWLDTVGVNHVAEGPFAMAGPQGAAITGLIGTTVAGTTVSIQRQRYSNAPNPALVGNSPTAGTAACGGGTTLQGSSPRPSSMVGNSTCSEGYGFGYSESGGSGEGTTRDAITFTFSRPVWAFGAWFADLETRASGGGLPALVRVLDASGTILEEQTVIPDSCTATDGCGNGATRWLGFTGVLASSMVVIVGEDAATVNPSGLDDGAGFFAPSVADALVGLSLTIDNAPIGPLLAGVEAPVPVTLTNTGDGTLTLTLPAALTCPSATLSAGASLSCHWAHTVTQAELDAGQFSLNATADGEWASRTTDASQTAIVPLVQSPSFTALLGADRSTFDTVGQVIGYTVSVTNTGNVSGVPAISLPGVALSCVPSGAVAPGATVSCTGSLVTTTGADVIGTAEVSYGGSTSTSNTVTVAWIAPSPSPSPTESSPSPSSTEPSPSPSTIEPGPSGSSSGSIEPTATDSPTTTPAPLPTTGAAGTLALLGWGLALVIGGVTVRVALATHRRNT